MPRKYTQNDEGMFVPYSKNERLVPESARAFWAPPEEERKEVNRELAKMYHRYGAGPQDPIACTLVIDLLQRWHPAFYIRAKYIARALNERQDHYWFEPIAAGKIMSELADIAEEAWKDRPRNTPIQKFVDYRGQFYLLSDEPTTWQWLWKLRTQLTDKSMDIREKEENGINVKRVGSPWENMDTSA